MAKLLTASALVRVSACPASHGLPWYQEDNAYAEAGTRKHGLIESMFLHGLPSTIKDMVPTPDELEMLERIAKLVQERYGHGAALSVEESAVMDLVDGEVRVTGKRRDYSGAAPAFEVAGTWDLVVWNGSTLAVLDWKGPFGYVPPLARNLQLHTLARMAATLRPQFEKLEIGYVRLGDDPSQYKLDTLALDGGDLDGILEELRRVHKRAGERDAEIRSGEHCRYCPAFRGCPAKVQLVRALATSPAAVVPTAGELSDEEASRALLLWREASEVLGRIGAELYARSATRPIAVRPGVVFGPVVHSKDEIDGAVAFRVLEERHGLEAARAACKFESSKAAIKRVLDPMAEKGQKTAVNKAALEAIRAAGGVRKSTWVKYEDHAAGAAALPAKEE